MTRNELSRVFDGFEKMHILVIGDVMIDSYLWGNVSRISPEAPVPIIATTQREDRLGGAANVALNIQSLGATPILCSVIGKDEAGDVLKGLLKKGNLPVDGIVSSSNSKTTIKTRIISENQHLLRVDEEDDKPLKEDLEQKLQSHIKNLLNTYRIDAIIFEDYDKGTLTPATISYTIELANQKSIPTLVDPKKRNFMEYQKVTLFKPNLKEFFEGAKIEANPDNQSEMLAAGKNFLNSQHFDHLMVTMARRGVMIIDKQTYHFIPAEIRNIADVSGAGDTVISVSSLCMASALEPYYIAAISNMAGGLVCEHSGVVPIDKQELLNECLIKLAKQ
nr:bifunctional ADP-heptose synthase [uncultured Carboxylicivirga sp.]